jgi:hypothetical protein
MTNELTTIDKLSANQKALISKFKLEQKENKTTFDFVRLANVTDKLENKSMSKIYNQVTNSIYIVNILGTNLIPSFAEFKEKLPNKDFYSNFDGYKAMAKFNVKAQTAKKVESQNKQIANI